jgi:hypothetical protein
MPDSRRAHLRGVMKLAWDFQRAEPGRPFADCLRGAWKLTKGLERDAQAFAQRLKGANGRHVQLSPSLIRSPIQRSLSGQRFAGARDYSAARFTARLGY